MRGVIAVDVYLDAVKRVHDAMLHNSGHGTGCHVHGHRIGRQALVVVLIHACEEEKLLARKRVPIRRHDIFFSRSCLSLFSSSYLVPPHWPPNTLRCRFGVRYSDTRPSRGNERVNELYVRMEYAAGTHVLSARRHVIACVDRFLMGLHRSRVRLGGHPFLPHCHRDGVDSPPFFRRFVRCENSLRCENYARSISAFNRSKHGRNHIRYLTVAISRIRRSRISRKK